MRAAARVRDKEVCCKTHGRYNNNQFREIVTERDSGTVDSYGGVTYKDVHLFSHPEKNSIR